MNKIKKLFFLLMLPLILLLTACINKGYVKIEYEGSLEINVGTSIQLVYETSDNLKDEKALSAGFHQLIEQSTCFARLLFLRWSHTVDHFFSCPEYMLTNPQAALPAQGLIP